MLSCGCRFPSDCSDCRLRLSLGHVGLSGGCASFHFVVPDKQAAMIFVFLGYYPVVKDYLDHHMKSKVLQWVIKFIIFNLSILAAYGLMIYVFQMPDVMTDMGSLGRFTGLVTLLAGNIVFIVFELALTRIFIFIVIFSVLTFCAR